MTFFNNKKKTLGNVNLSAVHLLLSKKGRWIQFLCIWKSGTKRSFSVFSTFRQIFQTYLRTNALDCCSEPMGWIKETWMIYVMKFLCFVWRIALCPTLGLGERQLHIHANVTKLSISSIKKHSFCRTSQLLVNILIQIQIVILILWTNILISTRGQPNGQTTF